MANRRVAFSAAYIWAAVAALLVVPAYSRELLDKKTYKIDLVNTFAKGANNEITQGVDVNLLEPEKVPELSDPAIPRPLALDPDNPRCDLDHPYAYPVFDLTDEGITRTDGKPLGSRRRSLLKKSSSEGDDEQSSKATGNVTGSGGKGYWANGKWNPPTNGNARNSNQNNQNTRNNQNTQSNQNSGNATRNTDLELPKPELIPTKTFEVFVGVDYQVKPVLIGKLKYGMKPSRIAVKGSGLDTSMDLDRKTIKKTACGNWVYNSNGRYQWTVGVTEVAEAQIYYYVKLAPGSDKETYARMPVNLDYKHEYTVAGSENNIVSNSRLDTAGRGGSVTISLDNVVAGGDNVFQQNAITGAKN